MPNLNTPFVHVSIDAVDAVILDLDGRYDPEHYDHYATFEAARDAALSSVEVMLDEGDYDGEDHRQELLRMLPMLESATSFEDLAARADYRWFLDRFRPAHTNAA